jgi:hypothetical protein
MPLPESQEQSLPITLRGVGLSHSSVDNLVSEASWESFYRLFYQYAQSRRVDPQFLDDVIVEAHDRIIKMIKSGRMPPKGSKALFEFSCRTVLQRRKREENRLRRFSEVASSSSRVRKSKRDHKYPDLGLVEKTLLLHGFSERDAAIIRATCLSDDQSKCPGGLVRPSSRNHERKFGVSYETVRRIVKDFKEALGKQLLIEKFVKLGELQSPSESPEQWNELLEEGFFLGEIAMVLDTADADKPDIGYGIAKHLPDLCKIYADLVLRLERLEDPEDFNILLSIVKLLFLACRYTPAQSKGHILSMCEVVENRQQSSPFFVERLLKLLPAYCARRDEEENWKGLWDFYQMDENDRQFSLDGRHLQAYNQPNAKLWYRYKYILLERSNKVYEAVYRLPGKGVVKWIPLSKPRSGENK